MFEKKFLVRDKTVPGHSPRIFVCHPQIPEDYINDEEYERIGDELKDSNKIDSAMNRFSIWGGQDKKLRNAKSWEISVEKLPEAIAYLRGEGYSQTEDAGWLVWHRD